MRIEIKRAESQDNRMEKTSFSKNIFVNQPPILRYTSSGRVIMDKIIAFLLTVKYDREPWKVKHQLSDIVLLIFFARLSGAEYWDEIEEFDQAYEKTLKIVLQLENGIPGIPSHDTLQRVFATLSLQVIIEVTQMWATILEEADLSSRNLFSFSKRLIIIDGKTIRGNGSSHQWGITA